ncbi:hypothetical protein DUNSADRAFT_99 [Dunaliella salina]|uniref:Encoded protein n=1 Tax=Dunaliella salina TaxID=3046 RepID=A0ABQ7H8W4_DUNSA|nr:hypothetical protein DUNSADRAFT_99 [Dunaliella salina]|eukprot:KAF5843297.1 hypothetical protein DUNSADRAFT_99 [Dunaliella salina]
MWACLHAGDLPSLAYDVMLGVLRPINGWRLAWNSSVVDAEFMRTPFLYLGMSFHVQSCSNMLYSYASAEQSYALILCKDTLITRSLLWTCNHAAQNLVFPAQWLYPLLAFTKLVCNSLHASVTFGILQATIYGDQFISKRVKVMLCCSRCVAFMEPLHLFSVGNSTKGAACLFVHGLIWEYKNRLICILGLKYGECTWSQSLDICHAFVHQRQFCHLLFSLSFKLALQWLQRCKRDCIKCGVSLFWLLINVTSWPRRAPVQGGVPC